MNNYTTSSSTKSISGRNLTLFNSYGISSTWPGAVINPHSSDIEKRQLAIDRVKKCTANGYLGKSLLFNPYSPIDNSSSECVVGKFGCGNRVCPHCSDKWAKSNRRRIFDAIHKMQMPRMMTVSGINTLDISQQIIDNCQQEFMRLREYIKRTPVAAGSKKKYQIMSYVSAMEIKVHQKGDPVLWKDKSGNEHEVGHYIQTNYNIHFHMIYDGDFIPERVARECFKRASKHKSFSVDIQLINKHRLRSIAGSARYLAKYLTKANILNLPDDLKIKVFQASYNKHFLVFYRVTGHFQKKTTMKYYYPETGFLDRLSVEGVIIEFIEKHNLSSYDMQLSMEENYFKYSREVQPL